MHRVPGHRFGGTHTDEKLAILSNYMRAYTTALKNQGFALAYVDAFAGSGDRVETKPALPLFDGDDEPKIITVPGSARLALATQPPFEVLVLVETDATRRKELDRLKTEWPDRKIVVHPQDANATVRQLCTGLPWRGSSTLPGGMRCLMFLDPYGMEVDWPTVQAIADTDAIDLWYFFPLMGLYRQASLEMPRIDAVKQRRLDAVLGTNDWRNQWYGTPYGPTTLFADPATSVRTADVNAIEKYVGDRLRSTFKGPVLPPRRIHNARGSPLASLFFAVANPNPKAGALAKRMAGHILNSGSSSHTLSR
ncbi:three-Cys-motif partner protein TcmP [Microbaculum marinum]|uniref:Three-Cys-motif partner protein TcmP n=1 Tax=Microbaculum marinum TaxID=1764581 RepID=A0AAW9RN92_9HYPH